MRVGYANNTAEAYQEYIHRDPMGIVRNQAVPKHVTSPQPAERPRTHPAPRTASRTAVKAKPAHFFRKLFVLMAIVTVFGMLGVLVARYAVIAGNSQEVFSLNRALDAKKLETERLKVEYSKTHNMADIEKRAAELGMGFAVEEQIEYVSLPADKLDTDVVLTEEQPSEEASAQETSDDAPKGILDMLRELLR